MKNPASRWEKSQFFSKKFKNLPQSAVFERASLGFELPELPSRASHEPIPLLLVIRLRFESDEIQGDLSLGCFLEFGDCFLDLIVGNVAESTRPFASEIRKMTSGRIATARSSTPTTP